MLVSYEIMQSNVFIEITIKYPSGEVRIQKRWLTKLNVLTYWSRNKVKLL